LFINLIGFGRQTSPGEVNFFVDVSACWRSAVEDSVIYLGKITAGGEGLPAGSRSKIAVSAENRHPFPESAACVHSAFRTWIRRPLDGDEKFGLPKASQIS